MMRTSIALAVVALVIIGASTTGAGSVQADPKFEQIAALVTQKMADYGVPGVAMGVFKDGKLTTRGFGVTNLDNPQPVTPDTVFPLASISKTVTATAIMRLVEQGKIDLDSPIRKYLPDFRVQDEAASRDVAVWHLLAHTPGWEGQLTPEDRGTETLAHFVNTMKDLPQLAAPGEVWSYNNAGFTVAGRVIEVVTGQSIHDALRTLVFEPIGLTRAFTRLEDVASFPFSVAHRGAAGRGSVIRPLMRSSSITAGGVSMSVNDLMSYARFHLGDGTGRDGKPVLTRASLEQMRTPRLRKNSTDEEMGLGWHLRKVGGVMTAAHGGTLGHCLLVELVPERNMALAILTNHSSGWQLIQDVERAALTTLENMKLEPAQSIGHRGVNETIPDVPLLAVQPDPAPYLGTYRRPPVGSNTVRVQNGQLQLDNSPIAFYGPDRAVVTGGNSRGNPVEFIRNAAGEVMWVRSVGRIARKDSPPRAQAPQAQRLPMVVSATEPVYPPLARQARLEGSVELEITTDGERVTKVALVKPVLILGDAAAEGVRSWAFAPHQPTTFRMTVEYALRDKPEQIDPRSCVTRRAPPIIPTHELPKRIHVVGVAEWLCEGLVQVGKEEVEATSLAGQVFCDCPGRPPIADAAVTVNRQRTRSEYQRGVGAFEQRVETDRGGRFRIDNAPAGPYVISVTSLAYDGRGYKVSLKPDGRKRPELSFAIEPIPAVAEYLRDHPRDLDTTWVGVDKRILLYPLEAWKAGVEGVVTLRMTPKAPPAVMDGHPLLAASTMDFAKNWTAYSDDNRPFELRVVYKLVDADDIGGGPYVVMRLPREVEITAKRAK